MLKGCVPEVLALKCLLHFVCLTGQAAFYGETLEFDVTGQKSDETCLTDRGMVARTQMRR